jgi:bifunctional DNA-binding transcriptional regulator/antitoxin component of YhaV-PrlF toxin-antitoxin module
MSVQIKVTQRTNTLIPYEVLVGMSVEPGDEIEFVKQPDGRFLIRKARAPIANLDGDVADDGLMSEDAISAMVRKLSLGDFVAA